MADFIDRDAFIAEKRMHYCAACTRRQGMKNGKMQFCYEIGDAPCRACKGGLTMADEYIKREDAIRTMCDEYGATASKDALWQLTDTIRRVPAADVAPVVMCDKCKHKGWVQWSRHGKSEDFCHIFEMAVPNGFFCAIGERLEQ